MLCTKRFLRAPRRNAYSADAVVPSGRVPYFAGGLRKKFPQRRTAYFFLSGSHEAGRKNMPDGSKTRRRTVKFRKRLFDIIVEEPFCMAQQNRPSR